MKTKFTPNYISDLAPNEIFVFGSNSAGQHAGGAAAFAMDRFGAKWGVGEGLCGNTYALPTMDDLTNSASMIPHIQKFIECAKQHPELIFYVTKVGCGIAGFTISEVAPLFTDAINMDNVILPEEFVKEIEKNNAARVIRLYYPAFVEIDGSPEEMIFNTVEDWKQNAAIKYRMFNDDGSLKHVVVYDTLEPKQYGTKFVLRLFERIASTDSKFCIAVITTSTLEDMQDVIKQLDIEVISANEW